MRREEGRTTGVGSTGRGAWGAVLLGLLAVGCASGGDGSADAAPTGLAYATDPASYRLGVPIAANVPTVTGAVERFSVAPPLPSGLELDESTGVVRGVPAALHPRTAHVFRATNATGSASATVEITVDPAASRVVFVAGSLDGATAALLLDPMTPRLLTSGTAPTSIAAPLAAAAHPGGELLFVADPAAGEIAAQALDPLDGRPVPGAVALSGLARPAALLAAPRGDVLWVAESAAGAVATLSVGAAGELSRLASVSAGSAPSALALSPDGAFVLAASPTGELASLAVEPDGRLAPARVTTVSGTPVLLAAAETGAVDHLLAAGAGGLSLLRIDPVTGALAPLGVPLPAGTRPAGLAFDPATSQAFVSDEASGSILRFALDADDGELVARPALALGGAPGALAAAAGLPFLVVADAAASEVRLVEIAADGSLVPIAALRTRLAPRALALGPAGAPVAIASEHAYVANASSARIHQFTVELDPTAPLVDLVPLTPPFAYTLAGPRDLALHPDRSLVLSADGPGLALESFARDPVLGLLAPLDDEHEEGFASDVEIEPSGRFAYATLSSIRMVRTYAVGLLGELVPLLDVEGGTYPDRMALDPAGRTLLVTDETTDRLLAFAIELGGGALAPVAATPTGVAPADVALHPSGRFAYVPNALASSLTIFFLDPLSGAPVPLAEVPTLDPRPVRAAVHPDGRSLYLLHDGVNQLTHWSIDPETGLVAPLESVETFSQPLALAIDPTGVYLVVTTSLGTSVHYVLGPLGEPLFAGTDTVGASPRGLLLPPAVR